MSDVTTSPTDQKYEEVRANTLTGEHIGRILKRSADGSHVEAPIVGINFNTASIMQITLLILGRPVQLEVPCYADVLLDRERRIEF